MKNALPAVRPRSFLFRLSEALDDAHAKFLDGDMLGLAEAILLCRDAGIVPGSRPSWVRNNMVQLPQSHLSNPRQIRNKGTGRHTDPYIKAREDLIHLWSYQAVSEVTECASTGDGRWAHATELLVQQHGINRSAGSVKRSFYLVKKSLEKGRRVSRFLLPRHPRITQAYRRKPI